MPTSRPKAARYFLFLIVGVLSVACSDEFVFRVVVDRSVEEVFWQSVESTGASPANLRTYLELWPDGHYAELARRRLVGLGNRPAFETATVSVEPDPPSAAAPVSSEADPALMESGATFRDCADCPEMVVVPPGTFRMGSTEGQVDERPVREVRVDMFALGRYEVTREEFGAFVAATDYAGNGCYLVDDDARMDWDNGVSWQKPDFPQGDRQPVVCLSWGSAEAYVRWLSVETGEGYRLPSEAEWEYGARAGTVTTRYWDSRFGSTCEHANGSDRTLIQRWRGWPLPVVNCIDGAPHTSAAGAYEPNAFGLHDMLGQCVGVDGGLSARELQRRARGWLVLDPRWGLPASRITRRVLGDSSYGASGGEPLLARQSGQ